MEGLCRAGTWESQIIIQKASTPHLSLEPCDAMYECESTVEIRDLETIMSMRRLKCPSVGTEGLYPKPLLEFGCFRG